MKLNTIEYAHSELMFYNVHTYVFSAIDEKHLIIAMSRKHHDDAYDRKKGNKLALERFSNGKVIKLTFEDFCKITQKVLGRTCCYDRSLTLTEKGMNKLDFTDIEFRSVRRIIESQVFTEIIELIADEQFGGRGKYYAQ